MLIVFDSYDLVGKTPTAKIISHIFNVDFPSFLSGQKVTLDKNEHKFWAKAQYFFLAQLEKETNINLILDRWYITEACYSPTFRNYTPDYLEELEEMIKDKAYWFYLTFDEKIKRDAIEYRLAKDKEEPFNLGQILQVSNKYDEYFEKSKIQHKFKLVETELDYAKQIEDITSKICRILYADNFNECIKAYQSEKSFNAVTKIQINTLAMGR